MSKSKAGDLQGDLRDDRLISEELGDTTQPEKTRGKKKLKPNQCRNYARDAVAGSLPDIVETFVSEAVKGSVPHFNLLTKFGGFDHRPSPPPAKRRGKSFAQRLLAEMRQHEARLIAANEKRLAAEREAAK